MYLYGKIIKILIFYDENYSLYETAVLMGSEALHGKEIVFLPHLQRK